MVGGNNFQRAVPQPQLFLSKKEKQILEVSGHSFYERYQIPCQFLEIYILATRPLIENGTAVDIVCIYPSNQFQLKIRYILVEAKPVERHTGKCTDCLATAPDSVLPPALFSDASTRRCLLAKTFVPGHHQNYQHWRPRKRSKPGRSATSRTYTTASAFGGLFDMCVFSEVWRRSAQASAIYAYGGGWLEPTSAKILETKPPTTWTCQIQAYLQEDWSWTSL